MTRISEIRAERKQNGGRVSALVDGKILWFESDVVDLHPAPEGFASAFLLPSIHRNRPLSVDSPLSSTWIHNVGKLSEVWSEWWGYRDGQVEFETRADRERHASATALAFTCGVDSFFSLLTGPKPDFLAAVHGFDVPLADTFRMNAFISSAEAVAAETDTRLVVIRTNLREHPASGSRRLWERAHGGGLAAVGHFLSDHIGRFTISSSYSTRNRRPWGSSGTTDPLFSSDRLSISQYGLEHSRDSKISQLAGSELAQKHLRVCWENSVAAGNCSRCAKCLATMLVLAEVDALEKFTVFDGPGVLARRLDELPYLKNNINIIQRIVNRGNLDRRTDAGARRLLIRSRRAAAIRHFGERLRTAILANA